MCTLSSPGPATGCGFKLMLIAPLHSRWLLRNAVDRSLALCCNAFQLRYRMATSPDIVALTNSVRAASSEIHTCSSSIDGVVTDHLRPGQRALHRQAVRERG